MNINYQDLVPADFNDNSHVWVYQSNRIFTGEEALEIEKSLKNFVVDWKSHGTPVKGYSLLLFDMFIILMADETSSGIIGGCSTDTSVRLMKNFEKDFQVDLFDRQMLAFIVKKKIQLIPLSKVNSYLEDGVITNDTLYFNNTILTKKELLDNWIIPVKDSWLAKRITQNNSK